jgi:hypothetical protein
MHTYAKTTDPNKNFLHAIEYLQHYSGQEPQLKEKVNKEEIYYGGCQIEWLS